MFAAYQVAIGAPFPVVSDRLTHLMNWGVLHGVSESAYEGGLETMLRVGPFGTTRGLSRLVRVHSLPPVRRDGEVTVALRWEASGVTGDLFPVLDAQLTLTADGADRSRLELIGSYRPPLGRAGEALDRAIMSRVAEATIRSLLEQAAAILANPPEPQANPDATLSWRPLASPEES
jgi:hypothetical protein